MVLTSQKKIFEAAYGSTSGALTHSTTYNSFGEECATVIEACNILHDEGVAKTAMEFQGSFHGCSGALEI